MAKTLLRWLKRYGPPEILGTVGVYVGFFFAQHFADINWVDAYAGAMGENLGFYSVVIYQRLQSRENLWHIFTEFGPAEILDSLITRPLALWMGVELLGTAWGLLAGKLVGDLLFYVPVILTHESLRRLKKSPF